MLYISFKLKTQYQGRSGLRMSMLPSLRSLDERAALTGESKLGIVQRM